MQPTWTHSVHRRQNSSTQSAPPEVTRARLRWLFWAFIAGLFTVYGRLIAAQWHDGPDYRAAAAEPMRRVRTIAAPRGKILARDGTVLADDRPEIDLALNYCWLQEPADPRWLRSVARSRLLPRERRNPQLVASQSREILHERAQLWHQLAELCGLTDTQWAERRTRIQRKVEAIAGSVESRQLAAANTRDRPIHRNRGRDFSNSSTAELVGQSLMDALFAVDDPPASAHVTVVEEISEHVIVEGLSLDAVAEIEAHPQQYPGAQLLHSFRREYPLRTLAAHSVGYLGAAKANENAKVTTVEGQAATAAHLEDRMGRAGLERQYELQLRGRAGVIVDEIDLRGKVVASNAVQQAEPGSDIVTTFDPALQRTAEALLTQAIARRIAVDGASSDNQSGGAVVVMNIHDGAILAAASAPRFDPNVFVERDNQEIERLLTDACRPLFDRSVQMALPPGSVFKVVSAAALLDSGVSPTTPVNCEGFLHQPEALRCAIFRHLGIGHGPVTMVDALARSCNVYFFHYAEQIGSAPLIDWGQRIGLGQISGIDLPGEVRGSFPAGDSQADRTPEREVATGSTATKSDPRQIAIGQGPVTVTPLQIARVFAAIANGGCLVRPHVVQQIGTQTDPDQTVLVQPPEPIPGLNEQKLQVIQKGLRQAVANTEGTAHATVDFDEVAIAGKTGTAEVGSHRAEHSWFAGYAPADQPEVAIVVVLEHAGEAATSAGPVVQRLVMRMNELGYFSNSKSADRRR